MDTIKLLEENICRTLFDINYSSILLDPSPREIEIKTKMNKCGLIKLKSFCKAKETINKMKRQPTEWEKKIVNNETNKELIPKIYKQTTQLKSKIKQPNQKLGRRSKQTLLQRRYTDGQQTYGKMLNTAHY